MNVTRSLSEFALTTTPEQVPPAVLDAVHTLMIDTIGATYAGTVHHGAALHGYARELGGPGEAVLLGGESGAVPAEMAAAINAQLCQLSGFENTGPGLHPGPIIVHTALAVGQRVGANGMAVLSAIAIGYEIMCRFHFAYRGEPNVTQNNAVAALIAARLLGLDVDQTANALSLALEFPARTIQFLRAKTLKRVSATPMGFLFSARAGIQAAMMSRHGFASLTDELDQMGDVYDLAQLSDWTSPFELTAHNMIFKALPAGHASHAVLQLVGELVADHGISAADVRKIRVGVPAVYTMPHQNDPAPDDHMQAITSVPWAISMQVHRVKPGPIWTSAETLGTADYRRTAALVELVEHAPASTALRNMRLDEIEGTAEIVLTDRTVTGTKRMADTWGSNARPMTPQMIEDKFRMLAASRLSAAQTEALLTALRNFRTCADVRIFAAGL